MQKNTFQDIVPKEKRTIRHIPIPESRRSFSDEPLLRYSPDSPETPERGTKSKRSGRGLWLIVLISLAVLVFAVSSMFSGAIISITPKSFAKSADISGEAKKVPVGEDLGWSPLLIEKIGELVLSSDGERREEKKATGVIVIYNNFSTSPQTLVKNTRFENPNGLIYRIDKNITIPGKKTVDGKIAPGSIEAPVYADVPGPEYNIAFSDFTIPGFEKDPARYKDFYARTKTPIGGGFKGIAKYITEEKRKAALDQIRKNLPEEAFVKALAETPENFILLPGAYIFRTETLPLETRPGGESAVREKIYLQAVIFNKENLSNYLGRALLENASTSAYEVPNLSNLRFEFREKGLVEEDLLKPIQFSLKGDILLVSKIPAEKIALDLAGREIKSMEEALRKYDEIGKAKASVRPFWSRNFPESSDKIEVKIDAPAF